MEEGARQEAMTDEVTRLKLQQVRRTQILKLQAACTHSSPKSTWSYRLVACPAKDGSRDLYETCPICGMQQRFDYWAFYKEIGFVAGKTDPWKFQKVLNDTFPQHVTRYIYDRMKRRRYDAEVTERTWRDYFEGEELAWLEAKLAELMREADTDFNDNTRVATTGKPRQMRRYKKQQADGCCGSYDKEVKRGDKTYWIGWNHSH